MKTTKTREADVHEQYQAFVQRVSHHQREDRNMYLFKHIKHGNLFAVKEAVKGFERRAVKMERGDRLTLHEAEMVTYSMVQVACYYVYVADYTIVVLIKVTLLICCILLRLSYPIIPILSISERA